MEPHMKSEEKKLPAAPAGPKKAPEEDSKGGPSASFPTGLHLEKVGGLSRWVEYRIDSSPPERRSYMHSCVYNGRFGVGP